MWYAHPSRVATQAPADAMLQLEHADAVAEEGCRDCELMRRGVLKPHGRRRRGVYKGLETLNYLKRMLDQSDNDWPEVRRNVSKSRQVSIRMRKLLWRKEAEPRVSAMFY